MVSLPSISHLYARLRHGLVFHPQMAQHLWRLKVGAKKEVQGRPVCTIGEMLESGGAGTGRAAEPPRAWASPYFWPASWGPRLRSQRCWVSAVPPYTLQPRKHPGAACVSTVFQYQRPEEPHLDVDLLQSRSISECFPRAPPARTCPEQPERSWMTRAPQVPHVARLCFPVPEQCFPGSSHTLFLVVERVLPSCSEDAGRLFRIFTFSVTAAGGGHNADPTFWTRARPYSWCLVTLPFRNLDWMKMNLRNIG